MNVIFRILISWMITIWPCCCYCYCHRFSMFCVVLIHVTIARKRQTQTHRIAHTIKHSIALFLLSITDLEAIHHRRIYSFLVWQSHGIDWDDMSRFESLTRIRLPFFQSHTSLALYLFSVSRPLLSRSFLFSDRHFVDICSFSPNAYDYHTDHFDLYSPICLDVCIVCCLFHLSWRYTLACFAVLGFKKKTFMPLCACLSDLLLLLLLSILINES